MKTVTAKQMWMRVDVCGCMCSIDGKQPEQGI